MGFILSILIFLLRHLLGTLIYLRIYKILVDIFRCLLLQMIIFLIYIIVSLIQKVVQIYRVNFFSYRVLKRQYSYVLMKINQLRCPEFLFIIIISYWRLFDSYIFLLPQWDILLIE